MAEYSSGQVASRSDLIDICSKTRALRPRGKNCPATRSTRRVREAYAGYTLLDIHARPAGNTRAQAVEGRACVASLTARCYVPRFWKSFRAYIRPLAPRVTEWADCRWMLPGFHHRSKPAYDLRCRVAFGRMRGPGAAQGGGYGSSVRTSACFLNWVFTLASAGLCPRAAARHTLKTRRADQWRSLRLGALHYVRFSARRVIRLP